MRTPLWIACLAVAAASSYGQQPGQAQPESCSIPLLRVPVSPSVDPSFAKSPPPVADPMPAVKVPAPPCGDIGEAHSRTALLDQRRKEQVQRLRERWESQQKSDSKQEEGAPPR